MQKNNTYNILCATDENFIPYCGVMLTSLFETNKGSRINVYVIVPDKIIESKLNMLSAAADDYGQSITFLKVNPGDYDFCPVREGDNVSIAAYYRILAPRLLPPHVERFLYLDCDIVVNGDISELYDIPLSNLSCAVVKDPITYRDDEFLRLKYSKNLGYFNSGMMLVNLEYWRANNVMEQCLDLIKQYPERILWHDQDALNYVLRDTKLMIDLRYNFQTQFLLKNQLWGGAPDEDNERIRTILEKGPIIIHYSNTDKPWLKGSIHPYVNYFLYYKSISQWKSCPLIAGNRTLTLKERVFEICVRSGLLKRPTRYVIYPQSV